MTYPIRKTEAEWQALLARRPEALMALADTPLSALYGPLRAARRQPTSALPI